MNAVQLKREKKVFKNIIFKALAKYFKSYYIYAHIWTCLCGQASTAAPLHLSNTNIINIHKIEPCLLAFHISLI